MKPEIIRVVGLIKRKGFVVLCICPKCGNEFTALRTRIVNGDKKSCGCIFNSKKLSLELKFGTEILLRWRSIKQRVSHSPSYVEKGINLCKEWCDFKTFYDWAIVGFDPSLEIDRINNKLGYSPDNCRWVTRLQNLRNRDKQTINEQKAFEIKIDCLNGVDKNIIAGKWNCSWAIVHSIYVNKAWKDVCERAEKHWLSVNVGKELPVVEIKTKGKRGNYKEKRKYNALDKRIEYQKYAKNPKIFVDGVVLM